MKRQCPRQYVVYRVNTRWIKTKTNIRRFIARAYCFDEKLCSLLSTRIVSNEIQNFFVFHRRRVSVVALYLEDIFYLAVFEFYELITGICARDCTIENFERERDFKKETVQRQN